MGCKSPGRKHLSSMNINVFILRTELAPNQNPVLNTFRGRHPSALGESCLALGLHHGASDSKLTDTAPQRGRGLYLTVGFTRLEAETQKTLSTQQIFIKYLSTFNLSHHAIYNRIRVDFLCWCRFNFLPNPYMSHWHSSKASPQASVGPL